MPPLLKLRAAVSKSARVTGRRYDFALPVIQQIDSPLTMIVNNGAMVRDKDGATRLRHLLQKDTACRVVQVTSPWRECTSVVFDRPKGNQVIVEKIDFEDGIRGMYYRRNREFLGEAAPLEKCLTEYPTLK